MTMQAQFVSGRSQDGFSSSYILYLMWGVWLIGWLICRAAQSCLFVCVWGGGIGGEGGYTCNYGQEGGKVERLMCVCCVGWGEIKV